MKQLLCLATLLFMSFSLSAFLWTVDLYDSFGDGWNGGTLTVYVNGTAVLTNVTLATGYGPASYSFNTNHGDWITTLYTQGDWAYENEYRILNAWGEAVFTSGAGGAVPASITTPFLAENLVSAPTTIGTGTTSSYYPVYPFYGYSYSQSLYLRSEIGTNLTYHRLTRLHYYWNGANSATNSLNWTIYMGLTSRTQFNSTSDWVPLSELTQVFSGNVHLLATPGWVEIVLDTPFALDETSNLVIAVDENTSLYDPSTGYFLSTGVVGYRSLIYYNDAINPDPAAPPVAAWRHAVVPNILFTKDLSIWPQTTESFPAPSIPEGWLQYYSWNIQSNRWTISNSNVAGGAPFEMRSTWTSQIGTSRLISPPVMSSDVAWVSVDFKYYFEDFAAGVTAKLSYSHDLNNWTDTGWAIASGGGSMSGTVSTSVPAPAGTHTYFAWTLEGNHYNYDLWYIDDVAFHVPPTDAEVLSIDVPEAVHNLPFSPQATLRNNSLEGANVTATCTMGNYTYVNTQTVYLAAGASQQVTFATLTPLQNMLTQLRVTATIQDDDVPGNDQLTRNFVALNLDTQAYADANVTSPTSLDGPSTFNLRYPETVTHLGSPSQTGLFMAGADWIGNHWYGCEFDNGTFTTDNYWRIDQVTGAQYLQGQSGADLQGIAWDPENGILYGNNLGNLYTLNRYTGAATLVGPLVNASWMISIAYNHLNDTLYGIDLLEDKLYSINVSTGLATEIGPLGVDINYGQDLAFDRDRGYLFLAGYNGGGDFGPRLYWINHNDGKAYKIGNFPTGYQLVGFAIPYDARIPDVAIAANGTLSWPAVTGASEYRIFGSSDPFGTFAYLGSTPGLSWIEPGFPQAKRFYKVTAVYTRAGESEPQPLTEFKDPLSGRILDPQPAPPDGWLERSTAETTYGPASAGLAP